MELLPYIFYLLVGVAEWWLALRRTLACVRGEKMLLVSIVLIENLLSLLVLSSFIRDNNWVIAIVYSVGAALGSLFSLYTKKKIPEGKDL